MLTITKDRALAFSVLILVGIMSVEISNIRPPSSWQAYGSSLFPSILLIILGLLALTILINSLLKGIGNPAYPRRRFSEWLSHNRSVISLFVFFGLYVALLPILGYLISTITFLISSMAILLGVNSLKKWMINLGVSLIIAPLIYVIFRFGLKVWLP